MDHRDKSLVMTNLGKWGQADERMRPYSFTPPAMILANPGLVSFT